MEPFIQEEPIGGVVCFHAALLDIISYSICQRKDLFCRSLPGLHKLSHMVLFYVSKKLTSSESSVASACMIPGQSQTLLKDKYLGWKWYIHGSWMPIVFIFVAHSCRGRGHFVHLRLA